jgi:3-oxoacyl-[acyl-carrier-protein] synthase III
MTKPVYIAGSGTYLPGDPIPFSDIEKVLGVLDKAPQKIQSWIQRTGPVMAQLLAIKHLHYAIDPVTREFTDDNITMAVKAAKQALSMASMRPEDIDLICYGSPHQDQMPTATVRIQEALGIEVCDELSIHANCTSAYKALYVATELIKSGKNHNALVISSNLASSELRAEYFNQELIDKESLFLRWFLCDGAGAVIITADPALSRGFEVEYVRIESIGGKKPSLMFNNRPAYWMNPAEEYRQARHHLHQRFRNELSSSLFQEPGGSIFLHGLQRMLDRGNIPVDRIKLFQVNFPSKHIADSVIDECIGIGIPQSAVYSKLDEYGYSGPPMALICLDKIIRDERFTCDDRIVSFVTEVSKFMQAGYSIRYVDKP